MSAPVFVVVIREPIGERLQNKEMLSVSVATWEYWYDQPIKQSKVICINADGVELLASLCG